MNVYKLKYLHEKAEPNSHFFDKDALKHFGERLSEMRVLKRTVEVVDYRGASHECYVLSTLQRNHPIKPTRAYFYFDSTTLALVL